MTAIFGGPFDGETLDAVVQIFFVPIAHVIDNKLVGVAYYRYYSDEDVLHFHTYDDHTVFPVRTSGPGA